MTRSKFLVLTNVRLLPLGDFVAVRQRELSEADGQDIAVVLQDPVEHLLYVVGLQTLVLGGNVGLENKKTIEKTYGQE